MPFWVVREGQTCCVLTHGHELESQTEVHTKPRYALVVDNKRIQVAREMEIVWRDFECRGIAARSGAKPSELHGRQGWRKGIVCVMAEPADASGVHGG